MHYTLHVVSSEDGFIAREQGHPPWEWASPEEQARFLPAIENVDWSVMGRVTHECADKPDRRRIVFSRAAGAGEWRRPNQLWLDPTGLKPADLAARVAPVRRLREAAILGGTMVHDWFLAHGAIDRIVLTIEPVRFGGGLPIFSCQGGAADPAAAILGQGFRVAGSETLNAAGTQSIIFRRPGTAEAEIA